ncbi:MAG: histone deacetylase [Acidobacteriota bacterium]
MPQSPKLPFPLVYSHRYVVDLGPHVFPAHKYRLVRDRLLDEDVASEGDFIEPRPIADEDVLRVHTAQYIEKIRRGTLSIEELALLEIPFSRLLEKGVWLSTGGTLLACERALQGGLAVNLSGGYHHAFSDHGEGFCLINDVAVALRTLRSTGRTGRAATIDLDVHQGNGTAAIFAHEPEVFTFSLHQQHNYPSVKPASDLDIGLPDGSGDALYLEMLRRHLPKTLDEHKPELVIYLAGADPYRDDRLGGLGLTLEGLAERDRFVLSELGKRAIPVAVVLAGGYATRTEDTVSIHVRTVEVARDQAS